MLLISLLYNEKGLVAMYTSLADISSFIIASLVIAFKNFRSLTIDYSYASHDKLKLFL